MATPGLIVSALRFPPALPSRLHTNSGLHSCHQFSSGIRSATAFGGFYLGGKCSAKLFQRFINGVHSSPPKGNYTSTGVNAVQETERTF
jgi:hypothetical protein